MGTFSWLKKYSNRLSSRFSMLVTLAGMVVLLALGIYFEHFLQQSFLRNTEIRMQHGFQRLAYNLRQIESGLQEGILFIRSHETSMAAIELINNYQDKHNYNAFLLDEEKKLLAEELLSRVKLSFNDTICLYDQNGDLVAYVRRTALGFSLNFISYNEGNRVLYRKQERGHQYVAVPLNRAQQDSIDLQHQFLYSSDQVKRNSLVTYQNHPDGLVMTSHLSMTSLDQPEKMVAHIEMSRLLGSQFFNQLSANLDLELHLTDQLPSGFSALPELTEIDTDSLFPLLTTDEYYIGGYQLSGLETPVYTLAYMEKAPLIELLQNNRHRFLLLLIALALLSLSFVYLVVNRSLQRPLRALMQQIHHIEQQNYSGQDVLETGDELEAISIKLNQLTDTIRDRENALETSKARLEYLSNHDVLTQLPNRRFFSFRLSYALEQARTNNRQLALMYLDLDQFKQVNDTLGHHVGDLLLAQVAERLRDNAGLTDTLARIGGDEFNILIERQEILQDLSGTARKLLDVFLNPFNINGQMLSISSSIGIAVYPQDGDTATDLIKHADIAMYQAKEAGRNNFCFFSGDMSRQIQEKARLHRALRQAIQDGDQFVLHYQPKISPASGQISGAEALVRWISPEYSFIPPDRFIPLAEESGLINALGRWVLKQGCQDFIRLKSMGIHLQHISINVSNIQLNHRDFLQELKATIADTGITPEQLELEMTESFIASDQQEAIQILQTIRNMGLQLAIDDFGTGYSAMSFLQKLPITRLKIDKSFVDGLPHDNDSIALVKAMLSLAENFNLAVTAEGVEYQEQMEFLKKAGCHEIQGYFYSRPLPFDDLVTYCKPGKAGNIVPFSAS